jgi:hypothetical protein
MTTLTGRDLADTYKDLLQVSNSNAGINTVLTAIEDGEGTASKLKLSSAAIGCDTAPILPSGEATKITSGSRGIILPAYFYPNNPYTDPTCARLLGLIRKFKDVPFLVAVNPEDGPGTVWDGNWSAWIKVLKAAGAYVLGYVSTTYAGTQTPFRTEAQVKADIDQWHTLYSDAKVSGIFLDEQTNDATASYVALYENYTNYCHARNLYPVVGNPGANSVGANFSTRTCDVMIVHEGVAWADVATMETAMSGNYVDGHVDYSPTLRAALIYSASSTIDTFFVRKLLRYVRFIYITDDVLPNPWDSLSPLLEETLSIVADQDSPGQGITTLTYGATTNWDAGETEGAYVALTGNTSMATPTNLVRGRKYFLIAKEDATGGRTVNFSAGYKFPGTTLPLTATSNKTHVITFVYDGTSMLATSINQYT